MAHRPMYCTNDINIFAALFTSGNDCANLYNRLRTGFPDIQKYGLEALFYEHGVDVEFWAHEHSYERLWPLYDYYVLNGSVKEPYRNPNAPVHIITGSAGNKEKHNNFRPPHYFSAFTSEDYGFTRVQVFNSSHFYLEQVSDDKNGEIIDRIWIVKDKHGSYENATYYLSPREG